MIELTSVTDPRLSSGDVCVIVSASWCGQCKMMKPSFEKMASATPDILFATMDADKVPDVASAYGIRTLPTAVVLKDGGVKGILHGGEIREAAVRTLLG